MKSGLLLMVVAFALFFTADGYRRKRNVDTCGPMSCPEGTVKCAMEEDNKENILIIKSEFRCIDERNTLLKETSSTRPNDEPGMKISRQKTSVNINKSFHSQHFNKQNWNTKNQKLNWNNFGFTGLGVILFYNTFYTCNYLYKLFVVTVLILLYNTTKKIDFHLCINPFFPISQMYFSWGWWSVTASINLIPHINLLHWCVLLTTAQNFFTCTI